MELIYNKIFGNKENNKDNLKTSITENKVNETLELSDSINDNSDINKNEEKYDLPSSISSISSIDSIDSSISDDENNKLKVRFDDEIRISELTEETSQKILTEEENNSNDSNTSNLEETEDSEENKSHESSEEDKNKKLTIESAIEKKYINSLALNKKKFYEEMKEFNAQNIKNIELNVLKNNYSNVLNSLTSGEVLYKRDENYNIIKICTNKNCGGICEKKYCNKSALYYSLWNGMRGVKTIYNLLLKLLILYPKFRNRCKCCEENEIKKYLEQLEINFNKNSFNYEETKNNKLELKINYLINKFNSVVGIMTCQCKFTNKYYEFYQDNYLNFRKKVQIYKKTIPQITVMLKVYFNILENYEELTLIKPERCMHEDIRYNNLSYCLKKKYNNYEKKKITEIINNLDLVNKWSMESFDITCLLLNEQSLETFRHVLYKYKKEINIIELFKKIYNKKNNILDLNYCVNKKNLVNSILYAIKNYRNFDSDVGKQLFGIVIRQLYHKNKKYKDSQNKINEILIQYVIECYNYENIKIGFEFFKNIKKIDDNNFLSKITKNVDFSKLSIVNTFPNPINKNCNNVDLLKYIFDKFLESDINYQIKNSYLKVINKNNYNVINYDFINKLIEIDDGEKIIMEMPKKNKDDNNLNYFLNLSEYKNLNYVNGIIKKCIIKKKVNILDYFLNEINYIIDEGVINPYKIYLANFDNYKKENEYIDLLRVIIKYNYDINSYILDSTSTKNNLNFLHFCIQKKLSESAKLLIKKGINTNLMYENKNFLYYCVDNKNQIVFGEIINSNTNLINQIYNNIKLQTYIFLNKELDEDLQMRFLIKLLSNKQFKVNHHDKYNTHIGFQILESELCKRNKILLFKIITEQIDPMIIKNNIPLLMHSVVLDEYEISYMLLNKLFVSKNIKKNSNVNQYFEYELINDKININIIPLVFKYVKENSSQNKILIDEIILEKDIYVENIIMIIIELAVFSLIFKNNFYKKNYNKNKKDNVNDFIEYNKNFTSKYDIEQNNNEFIEISLETEENQSLIEVNKNIWKNPSSKINNKINNKISNKIKKNSSEVKLNFKSETYDIEESDSSEIKETDICFDSII